MNKNIKEFDVAILAGGLGSRIKNFSKGKPKALIEIKKISILNLILNQICKYNIRKIFILAGYKGNQIYKKYNYIEKNFSKVECIIEKKKLDTGGAISQIAKKIKNDLIIINGDTIFDLDFKKFLNFKLKNNQMLLALKKIKKKSFGKLSNINLNKNKKIFFSKKSNLINGGIYKIPKNFVKKKFKIKNFSLENDLIPNEIQKKNCLGLISNNFFFDIGTPKDFLKSKKIIPNYFLKPAIFLDRDGTINYDTKYLCDFKNFKLKKGVLKGLKYLSKKNIYIFIVTNQAGLAKKKFTEKQFEIFNKKFKNFFSKHEIYFDDIQYCPFHPNAKLKKFKKKSNFRKPGNLMIIKIFRNWFIKKNKSFMIGDQSKDKIAAKKSGLYFEYISKDFYSQIKKISNYLKI